MATLKDVLTKIGAVKKTKQITKAMGMVATSKLRGAQQNMDGFRPYAGKFAEVLGSLAEKAGEGASPLLVPREEVKKINIVLCTSDRGLCGGFNANLIAAAKKFVNERSEQEVDISFTNFGKKGRDWCRTNKMEIDSENLGIVGAKFGFNVALTAGQKLIDGFLDGTYDEIYVVFSEFISTARQIPTVKQILPIPPIETAEEEEVDTVKPFLAEHICEPSPKELLGDLLPRHVYVQIYSGLLETSTSEHAAHIIRPGRQQLQRN